MAVVLTNLSNRLYENSRHRLNASAGSFGISELRSYDFEDLRDTDFSRDNKAILDQPTGMGYWLWKPYIILRALEQMAEGDILVYADSGLEIIAPLDPLYEICRNGNPILLFGNGNFANAMWTKRDCFTVMNCDEPYFWNAPQCDAAFCLFQCCDASLDFVREWLGFCRDPRVLTDMPNADGRHDLPDFIEHRRDQSVLSLMAAMRRLPLFRMPTQFGNHYKAPALRLEKEFNCVNQYYQQPVSYYSVIPYYNSPYGQLLDHHRGAKDGAAPPKRKGLLHQIGRIVGKRYRRWSNTYALKQEFRKGSPRRPIE